MTTMIDPPTTRVSERLKIRFPSKDAFWAAQAAETAGLATAVMNPERRVISVDAPEQALAQEGFGNSLNLLREKYGAEIVPDFRFDMEEPDIFDPENFGADFPDSPSLDNVLELTGAIDAWKESRGSGISIAIVDTGINGSRAEIPPSRRSAYGWAPEGESAWTDYKGHGTMCATIAAGSRADGGEFDGVAPEATVMACRTYFYDTELTAIYQLLRDRALAGEIIVASNSFGMKTGSAPPPPDIDFLDAMREAIEAGVFVVFSAGNYHELAGGAPDACGPTSIWGYKCREDVLAVGTCRLDQTMWEYSSRGPGQFAGTAGHQPKPDVTAPTPQDGRILYGDTVVTMPLGWGTSGACPQVAGLAALLRSKKPGSSRLHLQNTIRNTALAMDVAYECSGRGLINCRDAIAMI
ncbi:MAG TPA: S8 family serine peptidase [Thermoanaerobaculia bacterium]|nr:S8 family serine peptidase [Thermoanaerobaculia bacterium]